MDFSDLDDFDNVEVKAGNEKKFPCGQCAGTGQWSGGRNRHGNTKCNACQGKGYFKTDPRKLEQRRRRAAYKKAEQVSSFVLAHEELILELDKMPWNNFAMSMLEQLGIPRGEAVRRIESIKAGFNFKGKVLTPGQVAACQRMIDKTKADRAAKEEAKAKAPDVDLSAIENMFGAAVDSGYKKPMYRALGLRIKPGKAGALYVMNEEHMEMGYYGEQPRYEGKILDGKFMAVKVASDSTLPNLLAIAADPRGEAVRYGQRTGRCSCCGRELTKHASIEAGIGPICAEKWGLS